MKATICLAIALALGLASCGQATLPSSPEEQDAAEEPNACGGSAPLFYDGGAAAPGDACGPCRDGALVCASPDLLACVGARPASVCADAEAQSPDASADGSMPDGTLDADAGTGMDASMTESSVDAPDAGTGMDASTIEGSVDGSTEGGEDAIADVVAEEAAPYDAGPGWQASDASVVVDTLTDGGLPTVQCIELATGDLIVDPTRAILYASVSESSPQFANDVVRIDPATVTVTGTVFVGSSPNALATSDDGASLYVGDDGSASVCRVDLTSGGVYDCVYLGLAKYGGLNLAREIRAVPGSGTQWAVSRWTTGVTPGFTGLALYDRATLLGQWYDFAKLADSIAFTSPTILYGYDNETSGDDLYELSVDSTAGFTVLDDKAGLIQGNFEITSQGGWVFATNGQAVDGATGQAAGKYAATGPVWPDSNGTDVWYLQASPFTSPPTLFDFDRNTFVEKGSFVLPAAAFTSGSPTALVGWSGTGLAFRTPGSVCIVTVL